jgi:hypothetical protein
VTGPAAIRTVPDRPLVVDLHLNSVVVYLLIQPTFTRIYA